MLHAIHASKIQACRVRSQQEQQEQHSQHDAATCLPPASLPPGSARAQRLVDLGRLAPLSAVRLKTQLLINQKPLSPPCIANGTLKDVERADGEPRKCVHIAAPMPH